MIAKLKSLTNTEDKKRLLSNFFSLSLLQGANYILPLITFPYLVRILGVEYFGLLAFATAMIAYFNIITDYGFNLTATREVSIHREDKAKIVEIFSSVMTIKFILMFISLLLLSLLVFSFEKFAKDWEIYFFTFGTVIGQMLFPVWFFQGMERMKYITYLNILAKSIFTVAIFIFVQEQSDFYIVPILTSLGFIVAGVWSFVIIKRVFGVGFQWQSFDTVKFYLKEGWYVFVSRIYVSLYTTTNVFLLGVFTNNTVVGYYSIAEKIVTAIGGLFEPANQTLYPYLAKKYKENFIQFLHILKKIAMLFLALSFSFVIVSEYFKEEIVYFVSGEYNLEITTLLSIFLIRILTYPFGTLFTNSLIIMQRKSQFIKGMQYTVILNFILVPPLIFIFGVKGMIVGMLVVSFFIIAYYYFVLKFILKEYFDFANKRK